ncbi:hypothetical protein HID58_004828 [Brassica napus]|uniref:Very-long-chain (3R)-3-hydroxyacyl-CoA dehydratase n=2 Tax=Brassica TaxID=3705 RepID=A0ABQ8E6Z2_BRANA|nr:hypothetical protein HID58_004828 [Brassica napus]
MFKATQSCDVTPNLSSPAVKSKCYPHTLFEPPPDYKSKMSSSPFVKSYLFAYNFLQASSWTISLLSIVSSVLSSKTINGGAYSAAGYLISVIQAAAVLEVLHGAIGIVPSGFLSPLMQWSGRTHFILAIVGQINEVQDSPWLAITLVAWCIGEMIRYPHYALTCLGRCPYWLTYLRYTGFIIIYPTGLAVLIMYKALPHVKERNLYANFFSVFPFSYYQFLWAVLLVYPCSNNENLSLEKQRSITARERKCESPLNHLLRYKLLEAEESMAVVVLEFLECDGDRLMRLARNEFGNFVVFKAIRVTQEMSRVDPFWGLVHKLMPFLHLLRRSHGINIVNILLIKNNIANILESTI